MAKIGIMGGTFDPIHIGHLVLAEQAYREYGLDQIWFMPSKIPPHKTDHRITDEEDRTAMIRAAIADRPYFRCSDYELRRDAEYTYTADTLRLLAEDYPTDEFYFIVGEDSVRHIETWYHPEYILNHIPFLAAQREDDETHGPETDELTPHIRYLEEKYGARISVLHCREIDVSSAEIRKRVEEGLDITGMVPEKTREYIERHRLYRAGEHGM
ncbi:nicotinate-nucleotide adenylyltransferase [[Clostridium] aminophilum]|uniref:Probable nicotinate-nucleotide adenylyltransferase n=1 Tax=[Clostridium] aminophilum TaxID=1526 RepID=A0A1I6IKS3_9FIRM|nr:nicotinate-nucleotide adenylyltransferase [[Clostridium] aminophilum]SFR67303.1 nicotinate-nucleotide adenylyltransferase [[Clostridium] aminophilum]